MGKATPLRAVDPHLPLSVGMVLVVAAVDWLTPAGVVVGIFLCVPILLASGSSRGRDVWIVLASAIVAFVTAAILGKGPISPAAVWLPNRIIVLLTLPAAGILASTLQQRRFAAERNRDAALTGQELNRLLFSLLAHDLRAPLVLSRQLVDYVSASHESGEAVDPDLLGDVRARIERNLRGVDAVLTAAQDPGGGAPEAMASGVDPVEEIRREVDTFMREAELRGKTLVVDLGGATGTRVALDPLVLRQVLAILLDNAVRYAASGEIRVVASSDGDGLRLRVEDPGPGGVGGGRAADRGGEPRNPWPASAAGGGAGLGLELCRLLLARAGGRLGALEARDEGSAVEAWIPLV